MRDFAPRHEPVLLPELLDLARPLAGRIVVDCTVGLGGHSVELLRAVGAEGRLVGLDLDPANLEIARAKLEAAGGTFELHHSNFAGLPKFLGGEGADLVVADLGVASPHIDDPSRGFSYRQPGPLDMRMDPSRGEPAWKLLEKLGEEEIAASLKELGDEDDAPEIARLIVERRRMGPIRTTDALMEIVCEARRFTLKRAAGAKLHPAARTFQALRMMVNRELPNLERLLVVLPEVLRPGGIAAIISFHSGEDRRVKRAFREGTRAGVYRSSGGPVTASVAERERNPRSRSAKLRWARR